MLRFWACCQDKAFPVELALEGRHYVHDALAAIADRRDAQRLLESIDELQGVLLLADLSHNAVREENIIICADGSARLIRWYYATEGVGGDDEAFETLRGKILSVADDMLRDADAALYNVEA